MLRRGLGKYLKQNNQIKAAHLTTLEFSIPAKDDQGERFKGGKSPQLLLDYVKSKQEGTAKDSTKLQVCMQHITVQ